MACGCSTASCAIRWSRDLRVDFYQLSRDAVEVALPLLARPTLAGGARLLVVAGDAALRERISEGLWSRLPDSFLAHGEAGTPHEARQPILLSEVVTAPVNGARFLALADGQWREPGGIFDRVFLLFAADDAQDARRAWRLLDAREGAERRFWKQEGGKWVEGP